MVWELGEVLARMGAGSQSFEPKTSPVYGAITPADIAAAVGTVRVKSAAALVQAKYIDHDPARFNTDLLVRRYQYTCTHRMRRIDTIEKLAGASVKFYFREPRCRKCRGYTQEWDSKALQFIPCTSCAGTGGRAASVREIAKLSGMSRSKLKTAHVRCFWEMHQILTIWESIASAQIRRALRK